MTPGERAPDPREARSPADFLARLQALKDWSGLTYRELAARAEAHGDVLPCSTVANMLTRPTLPREELLTVFARACGLPPEELETWRTVRGRLAGRRPHPAGDPDPADLAHPTDPMHSTDPEDPTDGAGAGGEAGPAGSVETGGRTESGAAVAPGDGTAAGDVSGVPAWPGEPGAGAAGGSGARSRIRRTVVAAVALAGLVLAGVSVVAVLRDGRGGHPPHMVTAPAVGDVRIRVSGTDHCLGERRGARTGQIHQVPCAGAGVPLYSLEETGGGRWRIVSDHPDYGPGCSGIPSGGRIPGAAFEDSECGDPSRVESFTLEAYGTPVQGFRIVPAGSATPGSCVTVVGDRSAAWARLAQAPCAPDAAGQLFDFDRRD
ncbi:helix-turn-helix domain-containing protein [Streptomyces sp. NPDC059534]|uniref:helix-turn-helix domain-containing protein n=1 Tax=Streptomyces sp. NPDC059534 TaxID=3346859 RepID=UPI00368DC83E